VHRAALAAGVAPPPAGQLGHDALRVHAADQHVAVIAVSRDHLVALSGRHLHANDDRLLADVEVAEAADQAHAVHLPRLLLEAADQQHLAIGVKLFVLVEGGGVLARFSAVVRFPALVLGRAFLGAAGGARGDGHRFSPKRFLAGVLAQSREESERPATPERGDGQAFKLWKGLHDLAASHQFCRIFDPFITTSLLALAVSLPLASMVMSLPSILMVPSFLEDTDASPVFKTSSS
jgi:hypothetical protein